MANSCKISVAVGTYNGETYIEEQLRSLFLQTRLPDEIIISDDHSSDRTLALADEVLASFKRHGNIRVKILKSDRNLGVVGNFARAFEACTGDILFPCDQDDVWKPDKIKIMADIFESAPGCSVVFSNAELTDSELRPLGRNLWSSLNFSPVMVGRGKEYENIFRLLLNRCVVTGTAMAFRRSLLPDAMPLSTFWIHDGWLAILCSCLSEIRPVDQCLLSYRQHEKNVVGANSSDPFSRVRRYLGNFSAVRKIRLQRRNRYQDVLNRLEDLGRLPAPEDLSELKRCIAFWNRKLSLDSRGFFQGFAIIVSDCLNGGYRKFYSGFRGAVRDFFCLFHRGNRPAR